MEEIKGIVGEVRSYPDKCDTHIHPYAQLILPLEGSLFIQTDTDCFEQSKQRIFFLSPNCNHSFYSKNRNKFLVLDIPSYYLSAQELNRMKNTVSLVLDNRWKALRFLMLNEIENSYLESQSMTHLLRYALPLLLEDNQPSSILYIHENYYKKLTIQQLAELEHYNPSYYCEWFFKKTGNTPFKYIQKIRLEKSKELLLDTDFSLLQIAQQVGYEHQSSLTKLFKEAEDILPSEYRRKYRK